MDEGIKPQFNARKNIILTLLALTGVGTFVYFFFPDPIDWTLFFRPAVTGANVFSTFFQPPARQASTIQKKASGAPICGFARIKKSPIALGSTNPK